MAERCKSCDHDTQAHAPDRSGCLFEISQVGGCADRICPCTVDAYRPVPCKATEDATGITCRRDSGHPDDHEGQHIPRTDGTESIGYPLFVRWPYTRYDSDCGIRPQITAGLA